MSGMIRSFAQNAYKVGARLYLNPKLRHEWKKRTGRRRNERPVEYAFAMKWLARLYPKTILDVGSGTTSFPQVMADCGFHVTAIDKITGYWNDMFFNRHYYIIDDDITSPRLKEKFDIVTCISVLEHIRDHQLAVKGIFSLLRSGGHIVLTFPYNEKEYIPNVYQLPGAGYGQDWSFICQVFSRREIDDWLSQNSARIIDQEYYQSFTGDYWTFGQRLYPQRRVKMEEKHHLTCLTLQAI